MDQEGRAKVMEDVKHSDRGGAAAGVADERLNEL